MVPVGAGLLALVAWLAGAAAAGREAPAPVVHVSEDACEAARCHLLTVSCQGLPPREVRVREFPAAEPRGAAILTTGVFGIRRYDDSPERRRTVQTLRDAGLEVFQLEWGGGNKGWGTGAEGAGLSRALCAFAEVVRWIAAERSSRPELLCAQGNSGGALQIAYGLSVYGLEELFDMVILTGGPPISRMDGFCFGAPRESGAKESGRRFVDYIMGWRGAGDHCLQQLATETAVAAARRDSLVSEEVPRDLDFPATKVNFVVSERDRSAREAKVYYDALRSAKDWLSIPGNTHAIDNVEEGAGPIRRLFLDECRER